MLIFSWDTLYKRDCFIIPAKGKASNASAGIIAAIAEQAGKLEPQSTPPLICYENDNRSCFIQRGGTITSAIYKSL